MIEGRCKILGKYSHYSTVYGKTLKNEEVITLTQSDDESLDPIPPSPAFPFVAVRLEFYTLGGLRYIGDVVLTPNALIYPEGTKYAIIIWEDGAQIYYEEVWVDEIPISEALRLLRYVQHAQQENLY